MKFALPLILKIVLLTVLLPNHGIAQESFDRGIENFDQGNYEAAYKIWKPLADAGDPQAQYALGALYTDATGKFNNPKKALKWYRKAADQGHPESLFNVGNAYWSGQVVKTNREKAVVFWRQAAQRGLSYAQYNLASAYYSGQGTRRNLDLAIFWFKKAAIKDDTDARQVLVKLRKSYPQYFTDNDQTITRESNGQQTATEKSSLSDSVPGGISDEKSGVQGENAVNFLNTDKVLAENKKKDTSGRAVASRNRLQPLPGNYRVNGRALLLSRRAGGFVLKQLAHDTRVEVVTVTNGWAQVRTIAGFDVWIYALLADIVGERAIVNRQNVRARPLPSTASYAHPIGNFSKGEVLQIIERSGAWLKVRGGRKLLAWMNFNRLTRL